MYNLESEWPAHNQGKTLGWKAREKTQYKKQHNYMIQLLGNNKQNNISTNNKNTSMPYNWQADSQLNSRCKSSYALEYITKGHIAIHTILF